MKVSELTFRNFTVLSLFEGGKYIDIAQKMSDEQIRIIYGWMFGKEAPDASSEDLQRQMIVKMDAVNRNYGRWLDNLLALEVRANQLVNRSID